MFSQTLPREWILLLDCMQTNQKHLSATEINEIKSSLQNLNKSLNHLPSEKIAPLLKSLLYRQLMESPPIGGQKTTVSQAEIESFFSTYNSKIKGSLCSFTSWIVESLESDFTSLKNKYPNSEATSSRDLTATFRSYLPAWINLLESLNSTDKEKVLIKYYFVLIQDISKLMSLYTMFSAQQPTVNNYINWNFDSTISEQLKISSPLTEQKEKSPAELIESNLPNNDTTKNKSELIDEVIRKRKGEAN